MRIIYTNNKGGVSVVIPAPQFDNQDKIDFVAKKDVPSGIDYWIVDNDFIPTDRADRESWVLDTVAMGTPSGVGA